MIKYYVDGGSGQHVFITRDDVFSNVLTRSDWSNHARTPPVGVHHVQDLSDGNALHAGIMDASAHM